MLTLPEWVDRILPRGRILRSVLLLGGGTAVTQLITIVTAPIFTRLYSPGDYGVSGVFGNLLTMLVIVATAQYEQSITLPRTEEAAVDLVRLVWPSPFWLRACAAALFGSSRARC